jgi:hypothetical protein
LHVSCYHNNIHLRLSLLFIFTQTRFGYRGHHQCDLYAYRSCSLNSLYILYTLTC